MSLQWLLDTSAAAIGGMNHGYGPADFAGSIQDDGPLGCGAEASEKGIYCSRMSFLNQGVTRVESELEDVN